MVGWARAITPFHDPHVADPHLGILILAERVPDPICVTVRASMSGVTWLFTITNVCSDAGTGLAQFKPSPPSARLKSSAANGGVVLPLGCVGVAVGVGVGVTDGHDSPPRVMNVAGLF